MLHCLCGVLLMHRTAYAPYCLSDILHKPGQVSCVAQAVEFTVKDPDGYAVTVSERRACELIGHA